MVASTYDDDKHNGGSQVHMAENCAVIEAPADPNDSRNISILDAIKGNIKVLLYCVLMTMGPLMYGYDSIIVGVSTAIPSFHLAQINLRRTSPGVLDVHPSFGLVVLMNAFTQVGIMMGSMVNGPLTDRFGRRTSFFIGGIIGCIATAIIYFADHVPDINGRRGMFLAGKIVIGFSMGVLNSTCQTYISEIAPPRLRGPLLSIFQFFLVLGQMIGVAIVFTQIKVAGDSAYRVAFASQWAFAGVATIVAFIVPESPTYLLKRNNVEGAHKSLVKLHDPSTVDATIIAIQATLEHERKLDAASDGISYLECFKGTNWRRTRIALIANAVQQFLGITLVSNSTYFLELGGMSPTNSVMVLCIGVSLGLPANVCSWFFMTIFGRRFIILASSVLVAGTWLIIGIAGCFKSAAALWYIGVMLNMIIFFFGLGVGGAYTVVAAETSSVRLRAKTNSQGFFINGLFSWAFNFFIPYLFNADQLSWGGKCGFFFFGLSLIGILVVYLEIPEMKNRTYRELDDMFEQRLKTRAFKNHVFVEDLPPSSSIVEA